MSDGSEIGRPERRRKTDEKIANAVIDLLRDHGPEEITMDRVVDVSGVAKTTLYRRYRDREEMIESIANSIAPPMIDAILAPDRNVSYEAFLEAMGEMQRAINGRVGKRALTHIFLGTDQLMVAWRERLVQPQLDAVQKFFERGVAEGVFDAEVEFDLVLQFALGGALVRAVEAQDLSDKWVLDAAQALWQLMVGRLDH